MQDTKQLAKFYPVVGDVVTVGPNKKTGDHSWCADLWKIAGDNETHVQMVSLKGPHQSTSCIVIRADRDFTDAFSFVSKSDS